MSARRVLRRAGGIVLNAPVLVFGTLTLGVSLAFHLALWGFFGLVASMIVSLILLATLHGVWPDALLVAIALLGGLIPGPLIGFWLWRARWLPPDRRADTHGSARFAGREERAEFAGTGDGLLIGRDPGTRALMRYRGPAHLLTLAPTRAGKGVGTVIPNLLMADRPVLVVDPKGENARIAGEARARFGPVHVLDPFGVAGQAETAALNPMDRLRADSLDLGEDAATLAEALVMDPPGEVSEAHWNEEAKALLGGLILFAALHEEPERRTLGTVRDYLTLPPDAFKSLLALMQESAAAHGLIARAANRFLGKAEREAASVLSNAQRHTHFLDSPRMTRALERSTFRFCDLRRERCSVFLVLPPNRLDAYARWLRLMVSEALHDIARHAEEGAQGASQSATGAPGGALPPALFLLDEFAALGRLEALERAMGLMAGYGLQLWPILQDMSQLKALYGARANTFIANAGIVQVFGVSDTETASWLSRSLGRETIAYETRSAKRSEPLDDSFSEHVAGRELLTPDEIMRLPAHLQLIRAQGKPPILAEKLRYYADPEFRGLFESQSA